MAVRSVLTTQEDFTGEFPKDCARSGLWRMNETSPEKTDGEYFLSDSSGQNRNAKIHRWEAATAAFRNGSLGRYFRQNTNDPETEQTYLHIKNDGSIFENIGERIAVGGWINPTTYSAGSLFCPIFNIRYGPGNSIFYLSLYLGRLRLMLYNSAGSLILDEDLTAPITLKNGGWYFLVALIEPNNKKAYYVLCDRSDGSTWVSDAMTWTGELNRTCTADIIIGMHADSYWGSGGFDDWFLDVDSSLTADDLVRYFKSTLGANGGDTTGTVDAFTEPGAVTLRQDESGSYPSEERYISKAVECGLTGTGKVAVSSEYTAGETAIALVETSTSDDLSVWSDWTPLGSANEVLSPNAAYIRYRVTLTTSDPTKTPKLLEIQLNDIPKPPYERLGFARPVVLDKNGAWEAVLENAFDIVVTSEVNGSDILEFKIPFHDDKRSVLENEKQVQIVNDIYRIRTLTDNKSEDGTTITLVYAEAAFYDLAFSTEKETVDFNADTAEVPMRYALQGTGWNVGTVTVSTKRTWQSTEKNALSILRQVQTIHGGDLIFDCPNKLVHLLTFGGKDTGALFAYRKNLKSIQRVVDTRSLVTRLYAYGKDGMTFASINNGREYVESYDYTNEVRISTLDCSSFTNPYQMLEFAEMRLAEYAKPRISYVLSAMDLSALTGYEHESWDLGDIVTVDDRELNLSVKTRIVRRQYNLQELWNTVLELSTTLRELGDSSAQWDKAADMLASTDVLERQEIKDLVPFNHLRNSRADNGTAYWINSGFEVDGNNGVSGTASFRCDGELGMIKSLSQTVYPASRQSYTFSAQIAAENLQKGASGQVGAEVTIEYEDGAVETRFIDLL
ncbi:MAG: phage tail protein [Bacteroides sp.]|nr:phage tail protein [Eubacterium sp.]MCM1463364.1 phage tail protein [Bacteroides sp.]